MHIQINELNGDQMITILNPVTKESATINASIGGTLISLKLKATEKVHEIITIPYQQTYSLGENPFYPSGLLTPWVNRVRNGNYSFLGKNYQLPINEKKLGNAIHGFMAREKFSIVQQTKNEEIYQLLLKQQSVSEESRKEERNRIAMELHDGVVNSVFTTRFNLMQLESNQRDKKSGLVRELEKTEAEIRRVSHELQENLNFNDNSIINMITNLVESQKNEWNTKFDCTIDKFINWNQIESEAKMNTYRIIQEALQNVNKYAKAERCIVMLLKTSNKITIRIWDNGIGFNPEKTKKGFGLKNIEERTKAMKGTIKITSKPTEGTKIEIIF